MFFLIYFKASLALPAGRVLNYTLELLGQKKSINF
jgi:hypothetical protein